MTDRAWPLRYLAAWSRARLAVEWLVSIPPRHAATMHVPASWSWSDSASPPVADIAAEIRRLRTRSPA